MVEIKIRSNEGGCRIDADVDGNPLAMASVMCELEDAVVTTIKEFEKNIGYPILHKQFIEDLMEDLN